MITPENTEPTAEPKPPEFDFASEVEQCARLAWALSKRICAMREIVKRMDEMPGTTKTSLSLAFSHVDATARILTKLQQQP